jgi:hypothetical protein
LTVNPTAAQSRSIRPAVGAVLEIGVQGIPISSSSSISSREHDSDNDHDIERDNDHSTADGS